MKIAIVEDLTEDRFLLTEKLTEYKDTHHLHFTILQYSCAADFISDLESTHFDIVFMDIYLPDHDGMYAAKCLREKDKDCKLIFTTCTENYLRQGYSVNACHYLIKPFTDKDFLEAMDNCRIPVQHVTPYLDVICNKTPLHLDTRLITFLNIEGRTVYIHMPNKVLSVNGTFRKITEPLNDDPRFLTCIQGVMVNMDYISGHEGTVFILKNGERVPFNIRNRKQILQNYRHYVFENMGG